MIRQPHPAASVRDRGIGAFKVKLEAKVARVALL